MYVEAGSDNQVESERVSIRVTNTDKRNEEWVSANGNYGAIARGYIGVTPNKQYTVELYIRSRLDDTVIAYRYYIKYSPEINKQTPTVTDY